MNFLEDKLRSDLQERFPNMDKEAFAEALNIALNRIRHKAKAEIIKKIKEAEREE